MGCYVEVSNKQEWLQSNCTYAWEGLVFPKWEDFKEGHLPVVLVDNGYFQAAGIAFDKQEYERFTDPCDFRPKVVYSIALEELKKVSDIESYLTKEEDNV